MEATSNAARRDAPPGTYVANHCYGTPGPARLLARVLTIAVMAALSVYGGAAAGSPLTEAQVKAGLLFNFLSFVKWPVAADDSAFVIGVVGADPVTAALRHAHGQIVMNRSVEIREIQGEAEARECHVLFVPASRDREAPALLYALRDDPVLTVGEHEEFTRIGGVIRMYPDRSRLRLEIDVGRAERARLRISSKLLDLSRVVKDGHVVR